MRRACSLILLLALCLSLANQSRAATTAEQLQSQIADRNQKIQALEKEIAGYQASLTAASKKSDSLSNELLIINTTIKKLNADISLTENKIAATEDTITELQSAIGTKSADISSNQTSLAESLRLLRQSDDNNLVEQVASGQSLSDFWAGEERLLDLDSQINHQIGTLRTLRTGLQDKEVQTEAAKQKLLTLKSQLADQKKIANQSYNDKNTLLKDTKGQEAAYQKLLAQRASEKAAFEAELHNFEAQLQFTLNPNQIPSSGTIFSWPLDSVLVTQPFGDTAFSLSGAYNGKGHNGVDFKASVGTPVRAVLAGTVMAVVADENVAGCGYGRWVMIKHDNGLSSLYGHFSVVSVIKGQRVETGQIIGYSGQTGYATGPHLHLGVLVSAAVQVVTFTCKSGHTVTTPAAAFSAYLNPLLYLPKI